MTTNQNLLDIFNISWLEAIQLAIRNSFRLWWQVPHEIRITLACNYYQYLLLFHVFCICVIYDAIQCYVEVVVTNVAGQIYRLINGTC
jgi:hypothetical protein